VTSASRALKRAGRLADVGNAATQHFARAIRDMTWRPGANRGANSGFEELGINPFQNRFRAAFGIPSPIVARRGHFGQRLNETTANRAADERQRDANQFVGNFVVNAMDSRFCSR
jgi:hypothetical protein